MVVNQPHLGDVGEIYIHGLGNFKNGEYEISDEDAEHYRRLHTHDDGAVDSDPASPTFGSYIPKHTLGPSLEEAAKGMHGVTVEVVSSKSTGKAKADATQKGPVEDLNSGAPSDRGGDG
jgi:hypothetical protein